MSAGAFLGARFAVARLAVAAFFAGVRAGAAAFAAAALRGAAGFAVALRAPPGSGRWGFFLA
ncbi:MAG TPA: hypothetical protein PLY51_01940, partial [Microthrixaceae bacterium]|nr:hypothetical protein [Microthrixaceae bacterium]